MTDTQAAAAARVHDWLHRHESKTLLRFITCGSVDDGKSTLIGRLIYDCQSVFDDQLATLSADSKRFGTTGASKLDLALLVDGLAAEREQGITIDVAYRYFTTEHRKFIVADTPGHEQYTRNMATGASTADAALLLVDARKGILPQTRRHSTIVSLMGIRHLVLVVNKMDLVGWDRAVVETIAQEFRQLIEKLGEHQITCIPVSALTGDNVTRRHPDLPWYRGATLLECLEAIDLSATDTRLPLRLPVQWVVRAGPDFRGVAGTVAGGTVRPGDVVTVLPCRRRATVRRIVTADGDLDQATAGQAITLVLAEEIDICRGDLIVDGAHQAEISDQFAAHLVWMSEQPLLPGRSYLLRLGTVTVTAQISSIKYKLDIATLDHLAARHLDLNDIAVCNLSLSQPIPFDRYADNRSTGALVLIDRISNATVGCGMIDFPLRRAENLHWQVTTVDKSARSAHKSQQPFVLWFTGLSGAGKTTIADLVEQRLHRLGKHTMMLDGDNVRQGLSRDLGFTAEDRVENIRRVAEVARLMVDAGLITLVSLISPFRNEREMARERLERGELIEIYLATPLDVCERRDPKGLYRKARSGRLPNFTGIDSPYEPPLAPDLSLDGDRTPADALADQVIALLSARSIL